MILDHLLQPSELNPAKAFAGVKADRRLPRAHQIVWKSIPGRIRSRQIQILTYPCCVNRFHPFLVFDSTAQLQPPVSPGQ